MVPKEVPTCKGETIAEIDPKDPRRLKMCFTCTSDVCGWRGKLPVTETREFPEQPDPIEVVRVVTPFDTTQAAQCVWPKRRQ